MMLLSESWRSELSCGWCPDDKTSRGINQNRLTAANTSMIECEISSHDAYGTPRELFIAFFDVIAGTLREVLGAEWSPEMEAAWRKLLDEIKDVVARNQT